MIRGEHKLIENVTWKDVEDYINALENLTSSSYKFTGVYGLPRGGLVLAVMLSHRLSIPLLAAPTNGCLIVDDICDSGESLIHYVKNSSGNDTKLYYISTMYYKQGASVTPNFYYKEKDDKWIVFPWESK